MTCTCINLKMNNGVKNGATIGFRVLSPSLHAMFHSIGCVLQYIDCHCSLSYHDAAKMMIEKPTLAIYCSSGVS